MQDAGNEQLEQLRAKARAERALLSELNAGLGDDLKRLAKPASNLLDDVDMLLGTEFLQEPWKYLRQIERVFQNAVQHREYIEALVKTYGPNARIVGG